MKKALKIIAWCLFGIIIVAVFVLLYQKTRKRPTRYAIETVELADTIENKTLLTGNVTPRNEILLKPQLSGIIAEIGRKPGEAVKQGEVIARINVVPDMMQASNAESNVKTQEIIFKQTEERYKRDKELFDKGVVSKEEYETSLSNYLQAKEKLENSFEARDIVLTGRSGRIASTSTTLIRATISGTILDIPVKVGSSVIQANTFNEGTTIAVVADMRDLIFTGKVDETVIGKLHVGMPVYIRIGAMGSEMHKAFIEYIAPKGTLVNGINQYEMKAALKLADESDVRAGYSANAQVILEGAYNVTAIPESCVVYEGDSTFVYIVKKEKPKLETERRAIVTGVSNGVKVEVKKGLKKGEKLRGSERFD